MERIFTWKADKWKRLLIKYRKKKRVKQLIFVKHTGGSNAQVYLYNKTAEGWNCILECSAYVGRYGIGKRREGDNRTPAGIFSLTCGYGIKKNPGAKLPYIHLNKYLYWCGDREYYNRLIDIRKYPHSCHGEHLISHVPEYNYGMFLDYNKNCIYQKGSAIFLHCTGEKNYTGGCIAVKEAAMIKILRNVEEGARICIYEK